MEKGILKIMLDVLKISEQKLKMEFDDISIWNSLQRVEIIFAIEDELCIQFGEIELEESSTPSKLFDIVQRKLNKP